MKRIIYLIFILLFAFSCQEKYEYNEEFSIPTTLSSPESVALDVASGATVVLEWSGGGAADGSIVQYEVLFAAEDGNFENPLQVLPSDLGTLPKLTLTHAQLNTIARSAGVAPMQTGDIRWTITASKGGEVRAVDMERTIQVTRGEGIDNFPDKLFLYGSATEDGGAGGREFRRAGDGIFEIYTTLPQAGKIYFTSGAGGDGYRYYINDDNKLSEGESDTDVDALTAPRRITVDFNSLSMTVSEPVDQIKLIWADSWLDIDPAHTTFVYEEGGIFRLSDCVLAARHWHPGWGPTHPGSTDARYYFQVLFGQNWWHWRRMDGISDQQPAADEPFSFFEVNTTAPWASEQWTGAWMLRSGLHDKTADVVIYTNKEGMVVHQFENVR